MGAIKDIVDLAKDLESRAKEWRDMDTIHKIQSLALSMQSHYAEVVERDIQLMEENAKLKKELADANEEDVRIHNLVEFRKGKRTGNKWMPFCPKCQARVRLALSLDITLINQGAIMSLKTAQDTIGAVIAQTNAVKQPVQWSSAHAANELVAGLIQELAQIQNQQREIMKSLVTISAQLNQK